MTEPSWAIVRANPSEERKAELYASMLPAAWYVACVKREELARDALQTINIDVWLPECRIVVSRRRTRTVIDGPLFPGYLFVRGVLTDEWLSAVLSVRDVHDVLRARSRPIAACEREMTKLQSLMAESGGRILIEQGLVKRGVGAGQEPFIHGQQLRVVDGPFASFNGLYDAPDGAERIKLLLDILGRPTLISLPEASVEAVA
jgi:transcription antitermination factor NusG